MSILYVDDSGFLEMLGKRAISAIDYIYTSL